MPGRLVFARRARIRPRRRRRVLRVLRVGYHRGLDLLRSSGWRPGVEVHWRDETNRGFLRALFGLLRAAAAIGEGAEARRCREFLLELDPSDHFGVDPILPKDLRRRLPG